MNGVEYREGDMLTPEVKLESIKPQSSVIIFGGEEIEIPHCMIGKGKGIAFNEKKQNGHMSDRLVL